MPTVERDTRRSLRSKPFGSRGDEIFDVERLPRLGPRFPGNGTGLIQDDYARKSIEDYFASTGFALRPNAGGNEDVTNAFLESWVVYVCATLLADKVASIPLQVWNGTTESAELVGEGDRVVQRLYRPNRDVTWSQFAARGIIHRKLSGEDIWFLMHLDGQPWAEPGAVQFEIPEAILNCSGAGVEDRRDPKTGRITEWRYGGGGWFPTSSVVHFCDYDPNDPQRGIGAAEAAMRQLGLAFQAERYQESVMRTGGPGGFLISEQTMAPEHEEATQTLMDAASRDLTKLGRLKLLTGKWDLKANPVAPKDMVALDHLRWSRDVVAHLMRVPLPVIGILDASTYNNIDNAWREFWVGVSDYLNGVAEVMNSAFFPKLTGPASQYRCGFDFSKIRYLKALDRADVELALQLANSGIGVSLNDALVALRVEIDPIEGGDRQLIGGLKMSVDDFDNDDLHSVYLKPTDATASDQPPAPPPDEPKKSVGKLKHPPLEEARFRAQYHADWLIRAGVDRHERRLALGVKRWLGAYEKAQISRLRHFAANGHAGLQPNPPLDKAAGDSVQKISSVDIERWLLLYARDWEGKLSEVAMRTLASAFRASAADAASELGVMALEGTDPRVLAFLKDQEIKLVEGVTSTLAKRVRLQLLDVLQGATNTADLQLAVREMLPELTDRLKETFGTKEARALTIARTETGHAANGARFMQFREAGVKRTQWISENSDATRPTHRDGTGVGGEIRDLGEQFSNGLVTPHDPNGPASEVVNCLCTAIAIDIDEE